MIRGCIIAHNRKLLDKQKAGKKKMRQFSQLDIPQKSLIIAPKRDG